MNLATNRSALEVIRYTRHCRPSRRYGPCALGMGSTDRGKMLMSYGLRGTVRWLTLVSRTGQVKSGGHFTVTIVYTTMYNK